MLAGVGSVESKHGQSNFLSRGNVTFFVFHEAVVILDE